MSRHAVVLSRACALLVACRAELDALRSSLAQYASREQNGLERAPIADAAVALYADALWRARLFSERRSANREASRADLHLDASIIGTLQLRLASVSFSSTPSYMCIYCFVFRFRPA